MKKIGQIYSILLKEFGPQKWWPTTLEGELHPSYHGKNNNESQKFEMIVGAILTQYMCFGKSFLTSFGLVIDDN